MGDKPGFFFLNMLNNKLLLINECILHTQTAEQKPHKEREKKKDATNGISRLMLSSLLCVMSTDGPLVLNSLSGVSLNRGLTRHMSVNLLMLVLHLYSYIM